MRCPTCGKPVARGQEICSYCGALVSNPAAKLSAQSGGMSGPVFETSAPVYEDIGPMRAPDIPPFAPPRMPDEQPPTAIPRPRPAGLPLRPVQPPQPTRLPAPPAWTRWVGPLFLILIFAALEYWRTPANQPPSGSSSSSSSSSPGSPGSPSGSAGKLAITDAGFCKTLSDSQPVDRGNAFSASGDSQAIFFTIWKGDVTGHQFSVRWLAPDGSQWQAPPPTVAQGSAQGQFIVAAALPLQASMPLGEWHAELSQDGKLAARYAVRIQQ